MNKIKPFVVSIMLAVLLHGLTAMLVHAGTCPDASGRGYVSYAIDPSDPACRCLGRWTGNSYSTTTACEPNQYCTSTGNGCQPRISAGGTCPANWNYSFSALPCVNGLICMPSSPGAIAGICQAPCTSPVIQNSNSLPAGTMGIYYSQQLTTQGGKTPLTYSIIGSLPDGLRLDSDRIVGTPTRSGTYSFRIKVDDSCGTGNQTSQKSFSLTVNASCAALSITTASPLNSGTVNQGYSQQLLHSGGQGNLAYTITQGSIPTGLQLSPNGLLSGTTALAGTYNFTVQATDSCPQGGQRATKAFVLTITPAPMPACPPLSITTTRLFGGTVNSPYQGQTIQTTGGQGPVRFSVVQGSLPSGLRLDANGTFGGTPTQQGTFIFTVRATDSCSSGNRSIDQAYSITILPPDGCRYVIDSVQPSGDLTGLRIRVTYRNAYRGNCCTRVLVQLSDNYAVQGLEWVDSGSSPTGQTRTATITMPYSSWLKSTKGTVELSAFISGNNASCSYTQRYFERNPDGSDSRAHTYFTPPVPPQQRLERDRPSMPVR